MDFLNLGLDGFDDLSRIGATKHENNAGHHFLIAVKHGGTVADGMADTYLTKIAYIHGRPARLLHHDILDIGDASYQPQPAYNRTFTVSINHIAAGIGIVLRNRIEDLG